MTDIQSLPVLAQRNLLQQYEGTPKQVWVGLPAPVFNVLLAPVTLGLPTPAPEASELVKTAVVDLRKDARVRVVKPGEKAPSNEPRLTRPWIEMVAGPHRQFIARLTSEGRRRLYALNDIAES